MRAKQADQTPPRMNLPVLPNVSAKTAAQAEMFSNRLTKRRRHLSKWARRTGAGAYLLYDRDIPEIPLKAEYYPETSAPGSTPGHAAGRGVLSLSFYRRPCNKAEYENGEHEKNKKDETAWLGAMKAAAVQSLGLDPADIFLRTRERQQGDAQYHRLTDMKALRIVREYGLRYRVNLSDYLDTGLFLDRRLFRAFIRSEAAGRRVLNLFCYTGSLSVAAAAGGAAAVDSVDISNTYLDWARENFILNGLCPRPAASRQDTQRARRQNTRSGSISRQDTQSGPRDEPFRFIRADALRFPEEAKRWDIIILDPPAFSNSKKMTADFDLKRDHPALVSRYLKLLRPGGTLYLSANVKGFKMNKEAFNAGPIIEDITEKLRDEDFKGKRIPATYRIRV
jgi:23S rRNA G2069 N7-methylase RlmK/C1962 C5-methylase RlmI